MFDGLIPRDRVQVLENAVVDPMTTAQAPRRSRSRDVLRILYLSNLVPEKGCFELIEALERVSASERLPDISVRLVGEVTGEPPCTSGGHHRGTRVSSRRREE
jgi:hypothetical protein